ncbi:unnamed protein product [Soboliphyme baturini]|uniref:MCM_lid domain-containing protein n=1 Tax=Soboliphyme baturini TaxID=241478 RepID=A0A183IYA5_9BILA|nr:unnamed protein product [Soboliphyme baturini]
MLDEPDPEKDERVSEHVFDVRRYSSFSSSCRSSGRRVLSQRSNYNITAMQGAQEELPIEERLCQDSQKCGCSSDDSEHHLVPGRILRRYIAFARQMIHPKITASACKVLLNFFEEMNTSDEYLLDDDQPIGIRQMESLIRLVQARAKCELANHITERHALDVVEIVRYCMNRKKYAAATTNPLMTVNRGGRRRLSQRDQLNRFLSALRVFAERKGSPLFTLSELQEVSNEIQLETRHGFDQFLASLNDMGFLLIKGSRCFELTA